MPLMRYANTTQTSMSSDRLKVTSLSDGSHKSGKTTTRMFQARLIRMTSNI